MTITVSISQENHLHVAITWGESDSDAMHAQNLKLLEVMLMTFPEYQIVINPNIGLASADALDELGTKLAGRTISFSKDIVASEATKMVSHLPFSCKVMLSADMSFDIQQAVARELVPGALLSLPRRPGFQNMQDLQAVMQPRAILDLPAFTVSYLDKMLAWIQTWHAGSVIAISSPWVEEVKRQCFNTIFQALPRAIRTPAMKDKLEPAALQACYEIFIAMVKKLPEHCYIVLSPDVDESTQTMLKPHLPLMPQMVSDIVALPNMPQPSESHAVTTSTSTSSSSIESIPSLQPIPQQRIVAQDLLTTTPEQGREKRPTSSPSSQPLPKIPPAKRQQTRTNTSQTPDTQAELSSTAGLSKSSMSLYGSGAPLTPEQRRKAQDGLSTQAESSSISSARSRSRGLSSE